MMRSATRKFETGRLRHLVSLRRSETGDVLHLKSLTGQTPPQCARGTSLAKPKAAGPNLGITSVNARPKQLPERTQLELSVQWIAASVITKFCRRRKRSKQAAAT